MLERIDVVSLARNTEEQCRALLDVDSDIDVVLMVGVGAQCWRARSKRSRCGFRLSRTLHKYHQPGNSRAGLDPELIPLWLAHEIAHAVRYTSPESRSDMRQVIANMEGYYSYWETGKRVNLRELLVNEGISVQVSRVISPGHAAWEYFGYDRREYARVREMEPIISRSLIGNLDKTGLGLRLKYLSDGMTDERRRAGEQVLPERSGYYLGAKMVETQLQPEGTRGPSERVRSRLPPPVARLPKPHNRPDYSAACPTFLHKKS